VRSRVQNKTQKHNEAIRVDFFPIGSSGAGLPGRVGESLRGDSGKRVAFGACSCNGIHEWDGNREFPVHARRCLGGHMVCSVGSGDWFMDVGVGVDHTGFGQSGHSTVGS